MKRVLVVDDDQTRLDSLRQTYVELFSGDVEITTCETAEAASAALLHTSPFDVVSLDHDLGDFLHRPERTGMDVVRTIVALEADHRPRHAVIHSWSPRRFAMEAALRDAGVSVVLKMF